MLQTITHYQKCPLGRSLQMEEIPATKPAQRNDLALKLLGPLPPSLPPSLYPDPFLPAVVKSPRLRQGLPLLANGASASGANAHCARQRASQRHASHRCLIQSRGFCPFRPPCDRRTRRRGRQRGARPMYGRTAHGRTPAVRPSVRLSAVT